ncbi:unnamed protein product [Zymoseptoria tritici ST99CH_1A5]|nr:unnamed protein product [Zymoseptoria tritici ST99CH_1E4]SMR60033.1 unnamed protein product [Zymoseptoria tritici ST99CH_3D1]SMY27218.1 unnamed protein product [Zymoseptoria tritici ST99CH_1A5]
MSPPQDQSRGPNDGPSQDDQTNQREQLRNERLEIEARWKGKSGSRQDPYAGGVWTDKLLGLRYRDGDEFREERERGLSRSPPRHPLALHAVNSPVDQREQHSTSPGAGEHQDRRSRARPRSPLRRRTDVTPLHHGKQYSTSYRSAVMESKSAHFYREAENIERERSRSPYRHPRPAERARTPIPPYISPSSSRSSSVSSFCTAPETQYEDSDYDTEDR